MQNRIHDPMPKELFMVVGPLGEEVSGGTASYQRDLIHHLLRKGYHLYLWGLSLPKEIEDHEHVVFKRVPAFFGRSSYRLLFYLYKMTLFVKVPKDAIVITQRGDHMYPFAMFKRSRKKVAVLHGQLTRSVMLKKGKGSSWLFRKLERSGLKSCDDVIAVDVSTKEVYEDNYTFLKDRIEVIPVGVDTSTFTPMDRTKARSKHDLNGKVVLYVGRLEAEKDLDLLLMAFAEVRSNDETATLVLVGDGRDRGRLKDVVKELKIDEYVRFMGTRSKDEVVELMNCADVLALTSMYESGPLVVQEALACGTPCVTVDVGRVKEFVPGPPFGVIGDRETSAFASGLKEVLGWERKAYLPEEFEFARTAERTMELLDELWKGGAG